MIFTFLKLYKGYQIAQSITYLTKYRVSAKCGQQAGAVFTRLKGHMEKLFTIC